MPSGPRLDCSLEVGAISIDQATWRRTRKLRLTAHDKDKAYPGYTLYSPMFGEGTAYLLDMEGNEVHSWDLPLPPGDYAYMLPNGNLFYNAKTPQEPGSFFPPFGIFKGGAMMEIDWDGNIVWEHRDPAHHHNGRRTESGGAVYLTIEQMPTDLASKVQGGMAGSEYEGKMWSDRIVEIDAGGNTTWDWHAHEHLDPVEDAILDSDLRNEWTHGNTIVPLPGGDVIVSFRGISTVARIDRATGDFVWRLGSPLLYQQHDPSMLPNGNVLIFNNGTHRRHLLVFSNVVEVEPKSGNVMWDYRDATWWFLQQLHLRGAAAAERQHADL